MEQKGNPLDFIEDLLEEEKNSNQFFGHLDFWRNFEWIEVTRVYNPKTIEFRNMKLILYEFIFYVNWIIFVTLYISAAAGKDGMSMNYEFMNCAILLVCVLVFIFCFV